MYLIPTCICCKTLVPSSGFSRTDTLSFRDMFSLKKKQNTLYNSEKYMKGHVEFHILPYSWNWPSIYSVWLDQGSVYMPGEWPSAQPVSQWKKYPIFLHRDGALCWAWWYCHAGGGEYTHAYASLLETIISARSIVRPTLQLTKCTASV